MSESGWTFVDGSHGLSYQGGGCKRTFVSSSSTRRESHAAAPAPHHQHSETNLNSRNHGLPETRGDLYPLLHHRKPISNPIQIHSLLRLRLPEELVQQILAEIDECGCWALLTCTQTNFTIRLKRPPRKHFDEGGAEARVGAIRDKK